MDELKSSYFLEEEIRAQAREKAQKILADGAEEVSRIKASVATKLTAAKAEKTKKCEKALATLKKDLEAAKPLEESRFLVSFLQSAIDDAVASYIEKLDNKKRLALLTRNIGEYAKALGGESAKVSVQYFGLDGGALEKVLSKHLTVTACKSLGGSSHKGFGFVIENSLHSVKVTCTSNNIFSELLDKKRKEFCDALFGESKAISKKDSDNEIKKSDKSGDNSSDKSAIGDAGDGETSGDAGDSEKLGNNSTSDSKKLNSGELSEKSDDAGGANGGEKLDGGDKLGDESSNKGSADKLIAGEKSAKHTRGKNGGRL